jgi:tetratricopeptide (TPR) repeat protein
LYWQPTLRKESILTLPDLVVEHHQQNKPDRSKYIELLKEECASETVTQRHVFWLCRELRTTKEWKSLIATCQKFLSYKNSWHVEKAHCHCMYAEALSHTKKPTEAITQYMAACEAAPNEREPWFNLGKHFYNKQQWGQAYGMFLQCTQLVHRSEHYLTTDTAWGHWPHYMAALCMFKLQSYSRALMHAEDALKYNDDAGHIRDLIQLIPNVTPLAVNS